jgi:hypothetical protein
MTAGAEFREVLLEPENLYDTDRYGVREGVEKREGPE